MRDDYSNWLKAQGYQENTIGAQTYRVEKVESAYGQLDDLLSGGGFNEAIASMTYSTQDERRNLPNPSKIVFNGNIRNNLASYRNAAQLYSRFWQEVVSQGGYISPSLGDTDVQSSGLECDSESDVEPRQKLALERDLQSALRRSIDSLEPGLTIIDDGIETSVSSGRVDILCKDAAGALVVIELKAGMTDTRVVAQTLGYMGDLIEDDPEARVRGIIVAHDFDKRTRAAVKAVPNLTLKRYAIQFSFEDPD